MNPMSQEPCSITVALLTASRAALLDRCLGSLKTQRRPAGEVVVVVTKEDPETIRVLKRWVSALPLTWVVYPIAQQFAEARNYAVSLASGDWLAFIDDDCEAHPRWLERLDARRLSSGAQAIGGSVLPASPLEPDPDFSPELIWATGLLPPSWFGGGAGRTTLPTTANLFAATELFRRFPFAVPPMTLDAGGFSYLGGREDAEWWRMLRQQGIPTAVERRAIVWHHVPCHRVGREELRQRLEADGAALWRRTRNQVYLEAAARDLVYTPLALYQAIFHERTPARQALHRIFGWNRRQAALLSAAVDDLDAGPNPAGRAALIAKQVPRLLCDTSKRVASEAVTVFGALTRRIRELPSPSRPPRSLLVVARDNLGDAVLLIPMLRQLAEAYPETRLSLFCGPVSGGVFRSALNARWSLLEFPRLSRYNERLTEMRSVAQLVKSAKPDAILIAYVYHLSPIPIFFASNAPVVAWPTDNGLRTMHQGLIDVPVVKNFRRHEIANQLDLLGPLSLETRMEAPRYAPTESARRKAQWIRERAGLDPEHPVAVLQVEAETRFKSWPNERYEPLIQSLLSEGFAIYLDGPRSERDLARRLRKKRKDVYVLHGALNTEELAGVLADAALFVGVDSGPSHVAQAVGCPSLTLFGASEPHRWGPLPERFRAGLAPAKILAAAPGDFDSSELVGLPKNQGMRLLSGEVVCQEAMGLILNKTGKLR